jgi:hypothetical protein
MIRHEEITRPVWWRLPSGQTTMRRATFVTAFDDDERLYVRLVRVEGIACSFGREDAITFGQPVAEWEADAATCYAPGKVPL